MTDHHHLHCPTQALAAGGPVVVVLNLNLDDPALQNYKGGVYSGSCDPDETVAMLLVGMNATTWTARASWGATWGVQGHVAFPRGRNYCGIANNAFLPGEAIALYLFRAACVTQLENFQ